MLTLRKKSNRKSIDRKTETRSDSYVGDVTIDDFANALKTHARIKKAATTVLEVKQEVAIEKDTDISWYNIDEECHLDNMDKSLKATLTSHRKSRKAKALNDTTDEGGIDYPLDVWFIISEYISPEIVGKFARICRSSYHVATTAKFWFHLYKSYYRFVPGLPQRLQPHCMVRTHGLRACVIRTLHFTYFPLIRRMDDAAHLRQDAPHSLVKRQCCSMWHKSFQDAKGRWYFFFKLRETSKINNNSLRQQSKSKIKKTEFVEVLEEVAINPEERCKVLRVTCSKYSMLPPVIGLILQKVSMNLMPGCKDHRLQLGFGTSDVPNTLTHQVILTDVIDYKILDWWNPWYPYEDKFTPIALPQTDDSWD